MRHYNTRIIKQMHSYPLEEISKLYKINVRTIRAWIKEGLKIVSGLYPYLVMGYELKKFLDSKKIKQKCKLNQNEFWCTRCRTARQSQNNEVNLKYSGLTIGNGLKEFTIQGICEVCGNKLNRFSNDSKLEQVKQSFIIAKVQEA